MIVLQRRNLSFLYQDASCSATDVDLCALQSLTGTARNSYVTPVRTRSG